MKEKSEQIRKDDRASEKKHGEKRLVSLFLSCFSSSDDDEFDQSTKDEVLKPLYYIVGDVDSEQMEQTVQSMDDESTDKKSREKKRIRLAKQPRLSEVFTRLFGGRRGRSRKSEKASVGLATRMNETQSDSETTNESPNTTEKKMSSKSWSKRKQTHSILRLPFLLRRTNKHNASTTKILRNTLSEDFVINEEITNSDDTSQSQPTNLGVTFAHPAYTGKCTFLTEDARLETTNHLWSKMKTNAELDDDYIVPSTKTLVETTTAESWGSVDSSFYPTDEQSHEENVYYGSFDSDIDIPFDEIFTEASFFDI